MIQEEQKKDIMSNKVILITGGSRGIGASLVKSLAKAGDILILNYNQSEQEAKKIKQEYANCQIEIVKADVSNFQDVKNMIESIIQKYQKIDVLINNAGIALEKLLTQTTQDEWQHILNVNLNSVYYCSKEVLPYMINQKQGLIINISSIWGETGASCEVAYSTTKAAINGFTKALAKEVGPSHIRVNAIAPGIIDTDMNKNFSKEELKQIELEIPLERIGKTEDIAKCVKWLIEDEYTTGQIIAINGGWYI